MQFQGLPMNTIKLTKLERKFVNDGTTLASAPFVTVDQSSGPTSDISVTNLAVSGSIPSLVAGQVGTLQSSPLTTGGNLSKGTDNLSFYFSAIYDSNLLGSDVADVARGADWFLTLRATVDVTYNLPVSGRRRRRQVKVKLLTLLGIHVSM